MIDYPYLTIFINAREVELEKIISNEEVARSDFESSTFSFVRNWLRGELEFHQNTSGSTGTPKTISITREQMVASARLTEEALHLKQGFYALVCLDTRYIAGKMMLVRCFVTGMKIVAVDPSANPIQKLPLVQKVDFAAFVPYQVQAILSADSSDRLNSIQTAIIGGAALDYFTKEILQSFSCQFYATYGMTETFSHIALQKLNGLNASEYFHTLTGIEIKTDNRNCLVIRGPLFQEEIQTNDIVEIVSENVFRWIGRYDNVINSGGIKISPEKLEVAIEKYFQKTKTERSFFIAGLPDKKLGERIVLVIEGEKLKDEWVKELNSMFKHALALYEIPREILFVRTFFYTDTGKINRLKTIEIIEK